MSLVLLRPTNQHTRIILVLYGPVKTTCIMLGCTGTSWVSAQSMRTDTIRLTSLGAFAARPSWTPLLASLLSLSRNRPNACPTSVKFLAIASLPTNNTIDSRTLNGLKPGGLWSGIALCWSVRVRSSRTPVQSLLQVYWRDRRLAALDRPKAWRYHEAVLAREERIYWILWRLLWR